MACWCCCSVEEPLEDSYQPWDGAPAAASSLPTLAYGAPTVGVGDFDVLSVLGRGAYGKVVQVRRRATGELFAMKVMRKADVVRRHQVRHALTERELLQFIHHPFIVPLHFAFQSETHLYLVLALQSGGELFFHLKRDGAFAEPRARLYAAEILLALEAIHAAGYAYRDLKPENVLLDSEGHVVLSDFGLAKGRVSALDAGGTTFCGTPSYMAPEVLLCLGHGIAVDWWSLGTLLYEMLSGCPPFYSRNLHQMYRAILTAELRVGPHISRAARAILCGLLTRDPLRRLGARGAGEVRKSAFFRRLDFKKVYARGYAPPFKPTLVGASPSSQALDTSNFDARFTGEDLLGTADDAPTSPTAANGDDAAAFGGAVQQQRADEGAQQPAQEEGAEAYASAAEQRALFASWSYFSLQAASMKQAALPSPNVL